MLWTIFCTDNPNTAEIRAKVIQPHRQYLEGQKNIVVLAGATMTDDGAAATGSLFVINVNSREQAKSFSDGDPFTQNNIFANVTIRRLRKGQWNPEVAEGA